MKCNTFKNKLNDYMEGSLSEDIENAMKKHMDNCFECKTFYTNEKSADDLLTEAFSAKNINFKSSRIDIMKSIDKNRYKKSVSRKMYYFIKRREVRYGIIVATFVLAITFLLYNTSDTKAQFKYFANKDEKVNVVKTMGYVDLSKSTEAMELIKDKNIVGVNVIDNNIVIVKKDSSDGKTYLELKDSKGDKLISKVNISEDFEKPINFDGKFIIKYDDYNGDGNADFAIGQQYQDNKWKYRLYTIKQNSIQKIKFEDNNVLGIRKNNGYSPLFKSNGYNSLIIPYKEDKDEEKGKLYIWNTKTKQYHFEKDLEEADQFVYIPKLKKKQLNSVKELSEEVVWKDSPNEKLSVGLESKKNIYLKNMSNKNIWRINAEDNSNKIKPQLIEWIDDENAMVVLQVSNATNKENQYIYIVNLKNVETTLVYKSLTSREKITDIRMVSEGYEYDANVYDDANLKKYHKEKVIIPFNGNIPIKVEVK